MPKPLPGPTGSSRDARTPIRPLRAALILLMACLAVLPGATAAHASGGDDDVVSPVERDTRHNVPSAGKNAQVTFGVRPAAQKKVDARTSWTYQNLKPGQKLVDYLGVVNLSDKPAKFTVYPADGFNNSSGDFDVVGARGKSKALGTWISVKKSEVTVPGRSTLIMPFELKIPSRVEPGDYSAGLVASFKTTAKDKSGNIVAIDSRVGSRVYVRVTGPLHPRLSIESVSAHYRDAHNPFGRGEAEVRFTVRNRGNVRLVGRQTVRISGVFGRQVIASDVPALPELLPDNTYSFTTTVKDLGPVSLLTADVIVDPESVLGNVDPASEQARARTRFWAWSWPATLVTVLLVGGALWFVWFRLRRRAASRPGGPRTGGPSLFGLRRRSPAPAAAPKSRDVLVRRVMPVVLLLLGSVLLTGGPARADDGVLTFVPGTGMDISPMYTVTSGPCPKESPTYLGVLKGAGFPADGIIVVTNGGASMSHDAAFGVALQDTLSGFAASAGVTLKGDYTLTLTCTNRLGSVSSKTFTGVIRFTDAHHFTAAEPKTPPQTGVPLPVLAEVFPEIKAALAAAPADGETSPSAPASAPPATGAAPPSGAAPSGAGAAGGTAPTPSLAAGQGAQAAAQAGPGTSPTGASSQSPGLWFIGIGVIAAIVVVAVRRSPRTRTTPRAGRALPEKVSWPDDTP